ncbi:helix-turn-helix domain-containing protein [Microbacterium sp. H1-D42]|uniref:helix-turn-helix transcriptional regulator n=1 Tax=Microbacterium sp. H1-D42 TaxID=2925844 RepID=UPI001F530CDF|nr:helix-turn-helix domain-containing protein [Microbacterium sp. H1-D42]UNK71555.1 helix-turn-helix domain-containing protein [Microbacterium sp. H1-D42]
MSTTDRAVSIGALADETRRALYEFIAAQPDPVTRDTAADAIEIPAHMARFHLDKLVEVGLLETEFRRLSGRTGPGAGRPSKLYRRATGTIAVSLPERRYDLVGHLLAGAIERAGDGMPLSDAVDAVAREEGRLIAASATASDSPDGEAPDDLVRIATVLDAHGYEPRRGGDALTLANCPFDSLARDHTQLVCSANLALIDGILDGLGCEQLCAHGEPHEGQCCVAVRPA